MCQLRMRLLRDVTVGGFATWEMCQFGMCHLGNVPVGYMIFRNMNVNFKPGLSKGPGLSEPVSGLNYVFFKFWQIFSLRKNPGQKTRVLETWVENFQAGPTGSLPSPGLYYYSIRFLVIFENFLWGDSSHVRFS